MGAFATQSGIAHALPIVRLRESAETPWVYAQALPPTMPVAPKDFEDPKAFGQYLSGNAYSRLAKAGIDVTEDAKPEIQQAVERSADAAFRPPRGEIRKGGTFDALPVEIRRVIVLRNFNTFVDVLILVGWEQGKKLTKEAVNRVQGFICPLYPICTG
jgi:hypothetical protein